MATEIPIACTLSATDYRSRLAEIAALCLNSGPPLRPRQGMPRTVNSTVSTSPSLPPG